MKQQELDHLELHDIDDRVFADELDAIIARREAVAKRPNPGADTPPAGGDERAETLKQSIDNPDADHVCPSPRLGLVGLSLSGGGIRSATFNLGVIQVLAKRGLLRWIDYLSTVSGGGYIGSALSSTLVYETQTKGGAGEEAPFGESFVHTVGHEETAVIKHLRNGRDYLAPGGLRDVVRIPAVLLRGIFINLLIVTPLIGMLAVLTAIAPPFGVFFYEFEFTGFSPEQLGRGDVILDNVGLFFAPTLAAIGFFVLLSLLFPLMATLRPHANWFERNRSELTFAGALMAIIGVALVNSLPYLYFVVFNGSLEESPAWRVVVTGIAAVLPLATSLRARAETGGALDGVIDRAKLLALALLGPIIVVAMYLGLARLVLTPLTMPFGEADSALNVAARVLEDEVRRHTSDILDADVQTPYTRWANRLFDDFQVGDTNAQRFSDQPFYEFLEAAMAADNEELTASLRYFKRKFQPALWVRLSPVGMAVFGDNRFATVLRKDVRIEPATGRPREVVRADELLFDDQTGGNRVIRLSWASEALRKDIVVIHSGIVLLICGALFLYVSAFVNINKTGLHRFYRDRLSKAYIFDPTDPEGTSGSADSLRLTDIDPPKAGNPYHIINAALNIPATEIPDLQGRRSDFFIMSPRWTGSASTRYHPTSEYEEVYDRDTSLATALAISGAAAAPHQGTRTSRSMTLIMSLLNLRLDYWVPNLGVLKKLSRPAKKVPGPNYLLREISGQLDVNTPFINLSDGGHIENLGVYELLRRRCKYIVCCDAERDAEMVMPSLGRLTSFARMDQGVWIDWGGTLDRVRPDPDTGRSEAHWAIGVVHYGGEVTGRILYLKSSMCGDESPDLKSYDAEHPGFPHESTGDQFFNEEQFEAYRALGYLIANQLFPDGSREVPDLDAWFEGLAEDAGWSSDQV